MKELVVTSDRMVRVGLIEKVVFEQRLEEELTLDCVEKSLQEEETAHTKPLRTCSCSRNNREASVMDLNGQGSCSRQDVLEITWKVNPCPNHSWSSVLTPGPAGPSLDFQTSYWQQR